MARALLVVIGLAVLATAAGCASLPDASATPIPTTGGEGVGETLIVVVGDAYATEADAVAAADEPIFGDVQGFYVDVSDNYRLLDVCRADNAGPQLLDDGRLVPGRWLLLTAFRTPAGAAEFVAQLAATRHADAEVFVVQKLGGPSVGLGQEPHPDGSGPLVGPLNEPPSCG